MRLQNSVSDMQSKMQGAVEKLATQAELREKVGVRRRKQSRGCEKRLAEAPGLHL